jgi:neutral ceramidase
MAEEDHPMWRAGVGRTIITPEQPLWLAGYGRKRPCEGKRHDLWAKALALEDAAGRRGVFVATDLVGLSAGMYRRLCAAARGRYGLRRQDLLLTCTHNHCAPVTSDTLPDYYPLEPAEWERVAGYTAWLEEQILGCIGEALASLAPAALSTARGEATFAVNRRANREADVPALLAAGQPLSGPVDHSVPVLSVRSVEGRPLAVGFGYACHPTTLSDNLWCGDYPGYAQLEVEQRLPGASALFWTGCGGDQNPLPRRSVELCEQYGRQLADAVSEAFEGPQTELHPKLATSVETTSLPFERVVTREELEADRASENPLRARWAARTLAALDAGQTLPSRCDYTVQAWRLGGQLWLALGAEAVVDYSHRLRQEYGAGTWVAGYAHEMVGYVPSRRVWDEGGYEGGYLYEYGWPAHRWAPDVEERVAGAVRRAVARLDAAGAEQPLAPEARITRWEGPSDARRG